jgi:hypothetical protein
MFRTAIRAFILSSTLTLLPSVAYAGDAPSDESRARAERGNRKSEAIKGERRTGDPDDADSAYQKKSKAGEKRAEPAP